MSTVELARTGADADGGPFSTPVILVVLTLFLAIGVWQLYVTVRRLLSWQSTTGTVVDYTLDFAANGLKAPVVEFRTHEGHAVRASDNIKTAWTRHRLGKDLTVRYDAGNPQRVMLGNFGVVFWPVFVVWMLAGLYFVGTL